jgi:hypothetical protein
VVESGPGKIMNCRVWAVVLLAALLGGCTDADWDRAFSYVGLDEAVKPAPVKAAEPAQPSETAEAADAWCAQVAKAEQQASAEQGFDKPTQEHRAITTYQQCNRGPGPR